MHASLLPKLRGGAPIHKAIINNYPRTGVTIMYMVEKMDAGDIITQIDTPIFKTDNVGILHDRLSEMGTKLLLETIPNIISGNINYVLALYLLNFLIVSVDLIVYFINRKNEKKSV